MLRAQDAVRRTVHASGHYPNRVVVVGEGPLAELIRSFAAPTGPSASPDADEDRLDAEVLIEATNGGRHAQLAALRRLSALAPDDAVIISTAPTLSLNEIAQSVTRPQRLIRVVILWAQDTGVCEVIATPESNERAINAAAHLAACGGWGVIREADSGPSALTRLLGSVTISAWNLALGTGRPAQADRLAQAEGLPWLPLRELDRFGLQRAAILFDRASQVGRVESIYESPTSDEASDHFAAKCGTDLIAEIAPIGYFIASAVEASLALLSAGVMAGPATLRRPLCAAFGPLFASRVFAAVAGRYAEWADGSAIDAPT